MWDRYDWQAWFEALDGYMAFIFFFLVIIALFA